MMSSACSSCQGLQVLLMGLFLLLSLVSARPEGSGWSSSSANLPRGNNQQITNLQTQQGGLLPFPEGKTNQSVNLTSNQLCLQTLEI